ncbi:MAG TPA: class I SAM-dependent methyltransferase [Solirubrobacteraceae bacterium]|nr:class I SAM-dependent methyltransferase [Solirubrobacteraceae bacterium]
MGLVDLAGIASLLICPRCGERLIFDEALSCSSPSCMFSAPATFSEVGPWPLLLDIERSVVQPEDLAPSSPVAAGETRWPVERVPRWLRSLWKPANRVAASNVDTLLSLLPAPTPLVLVIGGGTIGNGTEGLYRDRRVRLVAFDIYGSQFTQFIADAHHVPIASNAVDAVVIQAVLEHVLDPGQVVREIHRVLTPSGLVYAETPFLQQVHAGAWDFSRYTASGHRYLFRAFEEIASGPVAGPGTQLLWTVDHVVRGILRSELAGKMARGICFWLRYLDRLIPPEFAIDSASACFFLGRSSTHEMTPREILAYYRGAQHRNGPVSPGA